MAKMRIVMQLFAFLKENRKWWLTPIIVILVLLGVILVLTSSSVVAPFIYTLF